MAAHLDLNKLDFGTGASEQERSLKNYFYRSLAFDHACQDSICLILGSKGSGKSAIFRMMDEGSQDIASFKNPNIYLPTDANLRNHYILLQAKLRSRVDFVTLWKFYFGSIVAFQLAQTATGGSAKFLLDFIKHWGLDPRKFPGLFGARLKIPFKLAEVDIGREGGESPNPLQIQEVFEVADQLLVEDSSTLWISIDELDKVAINGGSGTTKNHSSDLLSALMQAHSDLYRLEHIRFKFFIRSDVYEGLTYVDKDHFSNAILELRWKPEDLAIMLAMRIAASNGKENRELNLADSIELINRVFEWPREVPDFDRLLNELRDGNSFVTPRDLLNFAIRARDSQLQFNRYGTNPPRAGMISGAAVEDGLKGASRAKLEDFLTTFPEIYRRFLNLKGHNAVTLTRSQLQHLLNIPDELNFKIAAEEFCRIGAIGKEDERPVHLTERFVIPAIYRRALSLREQAP
ncbi:MAG: hypothetical protein ABSE93_00530 [Terriglobia bacterium]|jgi:hypothetical protein